MIHLPPASSFSRASPRVTEEGGRPPGGREPPSSPPGALTRGKTLLLKVDSSALFHL